MLAHCAHYKYNVGLYSLLHHGSHFFLAAKLATDESLPDATIDSNCPSMLAFASLQGSKKILWVPEGTLDGFPFHQLGSANLMSIINAEGSVLPVTDSEYDLTSNTCAHYALRIARSLNFERTQELTYFIVDNLLNDDGFLEIACHKLWAGGVRVLASAALTGKAGFKKYTEDLVASELSIHW